MPFCTHTCLNIQIFDHLPRIFWNFLLCSSAGPRRRSTVAVCSSASSSCRASESWPPPCVPNRMDKYFPMSSRFCLQQTSTHKVHTNYLLLPPINSSKQNNLNTTCGRLFRGLNDVPSCWLDAEGVVLFGDAPLLP